MMKKVQSIRKGSCFIAIYETETGYRLLIKKDNEIVRSLHYNSLTAALVDFNEYAGLHEWGDVGQFGEIIQLDRAL